MISSDDNRLKDEINYLKNVFMKVNSSPKTVVINSLKFVKDKVAKENETPQQNDGDNNSDGTMARNTVVDVPIHPHIILPYKGFKGDSLIKRFKFFLNEYLPENVNPRFILKGKKWGHFFL